VTESIGLLARTPLLELRAHRRGQDLHDDQIALRSRHRLVAEHDLADARDRHRIHHIGNARVVTPFLVIETRSQRDLHAGAHGQAKTTAGRGPGIPRSCRLACGSRA